RQRALGDAGVRRLFLLEAQRGAVPDPVRPCQAGLVLPARAAVGPVALDAAGARPGALPGSARLRFRAARGTGGLPAVLRLGTAVLLRRRLQAGHLSAARPADFGPGTGLLPRRLPAARLGYPVAGERPAGDRLGRGGPAARRWDGRHGGGAG